MDVKIAALGTLAAAGGGVFLIGSPERGEYYEMAPAEVASRLAAAPAPDGMGSGFSGNGFSFRTQKYGDGEVRWHLSMLNRPLADFTAEIEPDGKGTTVTVNYKFADNGLGDAAKHDLGDAEEFLGSALRLAMLEHIDSTLDGRPFDPQKLQKDVAVYAMKNPDAVKKYMARAEQYGEGTLAIEYELRDAMMAEAGWNTTGMPDSSPVGTSAAPDREWGEGSDPSEHVDDARGFDPEPSDSW